jgi:DNA-binding NtrC family response regulator
MPVKIIAAVSDDKIKSQLETLLHNFEGIVFFKNPSEILDQYRDIRPQVLIVEREMGGDSGLQFLKQIKQAFPEIAGIILSDSANTDYAVEAARQGADAYLNRIIDLPQIAEIVTRFLAPKEKSPFKPKLDFDGSEWLSGENPSIQKMFGDLDEALGQNLNILLVGEAGINAESLALLIHQNRQGSFADFIKINLAAFRKEDTESAFWSMLKEVTTAQIKTVYLEGIEMLPSHFERSIFEFLSSGKIPKQIQVILGRTNAPGADLMSGFTPIFLPKLSERKEDLIPIINAYLKKFSARYNKKADSVSPEVLELIKSYSWPGNYLELEKFIENAVLRAERESVTLEIKDIPVNLRMVMESATDETFEGLLLKILDQKFNHDQDRLSDFLGTNIKLPDPISK